MFDVIEPVLRKYSQRVDYMDVRAETFQNLRFVMNNGELRDIDESIESGFSVRCCHRGGWGFVSLNSPESLDSMAQRCVDIAHKLAREKTELAQVDPVIADVELSLLEDPATVSIDQKLDLFRAYTEQSRSTSQWIASVKGSYFETRRVIHYINSDGTRLRMQKLDLGGSLSTHARRGDLTQYTPVSVGSSNDFGVIRGMQSLIGPASRRAVELLDAPQVKAGRYTVITDPILGGTFVHEAFGHMSEADEYHTNPEMKDIFVLGKRFATDELSIYDTGLDIGSRGFLAFDDEGVPGQKTDLIRNGILCGRLHSRESAARFNERPTGSARTIGFRFSPICRMRNTCIAQGTASFEELLDGIKLGVYAVDSHGGTGGEMFSFDAGFGFMIRDGRIEELVRDVQLSGNLFKTLQNIDRVGQDFKIMDDAGGCGKGAQFPLETTCSSPHIRIRDITIGGAR